MRLLFITQDFPPGIGGIQTYSVEYASRLSRWCRDFLLISPQDNDHKGEVDDLEYNFDIHRVEVRSHLLFYPLSRILPDLLQHRKFDASFHAQWQTVAPALRARRRRDLQKVFVAAHARELLYNPYRYIPLLGWLYQKRREYLLRKVDHFFPVSEFTAGLLKQQGVDPDRMTVVFNGTDPQLFQPKDVSELKRELELEDKRMLLTVTRLVKRKGIEEVLHAVAKLQHEFDDLHYLVLGSGPEEASLKELASSLGIDQRVHFIGRVPYEELVDYYNMADLFVMSSRATLPDVEGFGIVFLEANACEKPVIGTRSGGVESAILHNKTGLVIDEEDPAALRDAIRLLLNDPEKSAAMGREGRKRVVEETNWDVLSRRLHDHMEALVEKRGLEKAVRADEGQNKAVRADEGLKKADTVVSEGSGSAAVPALSRVSGQATRRVTAERKASAEPVVRDENQGREDRSNTSNRRLLMIAPYFLPRRRVGALRPFRFAAHLKEHGWEPHVVTIRSSGQLTPLERELSEGVQLTEIDPRLDLTGSSGSQLQMDEQIETSNLSERLELFKKWADGAGRSISDFIDRHWPMDTWQLLFIREYRSLLRHAREADPAVIWSTGDPWSGHWLAERLSQYLDLPWVADFRDPWTLGGVSLRSRSRFSRWMDRRYEQRFIRSADHLIFTSGRTRQLYVNHYPEVRWKSSTITNSFDPALFSGSKRQSEGSAMTCQDLDRQPRKPDEQPHEPGVQPREPGMQRREQCKNTEELDRQPEHQTSPDNILELIFFGRFRGLSPASPVIRLLAEVRAISPELQSRIRITSFGPLLQSDVALATEAGVIDSFRTSRPVPPEAGPDLLNRADILLISTDPRRSSIIPAKLWDYLAVPVPVLSIAPNPEIDTILKRTGAGRQFRLSQLDRAAQLLADCVTAKTEGREFPLTSQRNRAEIETYSAAYTTGQLADVLNQIGKRQTSNNQTGENQVDKTQTKENHSHKGGDQ